ncbi:peroxiredoxin [Agrobacterium tumefaciens]|uniref:peroxiredoxin n=1 Tax=Agrobacterium tumefaciens TaxID=358 RepID=UPI000977D803|nr:peroxiredoxin [Agrobacterium tumefaciens]
MGIENLTAPEDDGKAAHLIGMRFPSITLSATDGANVDLSQGGLTVIYAYPRTSPASGGAIEGWDAIPGARGCTPQSCAFRDHFAELKALGVERLFGLSTQDTEYQKEAANRLHLPFPLLSDSALLLADALNLPLFTAGGITLLKRLTLIIEAGQIRHVFYPVFPPDRNASDVIAWLSSRNS